MKLPKFEYLSPTSIDEAVKLLASHEDDDAYIIAGGQTLLPLMAFRVVYPEYLIDINNIKELSTISEGDNGLEVGALARHEQLLGIEGGSLVAAICAEVGSHIAHWPIRTRGTFGGSLANADPSSEWCLLSATLDARITLVSRGGAREVDAEEYFLGPMTTCREDDELLTKIVIPQQSDTATYGFYEFARRSGDFALGAALCVLDMEESTITAARIGLGGIEDVPRRLTDVEDMVIGKSPSEELILAVRDSVEKAVEPMDDAQVGADYRRHLAGVVIERALERAWAGNVISETV